MIKWIRQKVQAFLSFFCYMKGEETKRRGRRGKRAWGNPDKWRCPECYSTRLTKNGFASLGKRIQKYLCTNCFLVTSNPLKGKR